MGAAIHHATNGGEDGFAKWDCWSRTTLAHNYKEDDQRETWTAYNANHPAPITKASIFAKAILAGWLPRRSNSPASVALSARTNRTEPTEKAASAQLEVETVEAPDPDAVDSPRPFPMHLVDGDDLLSRATQWIYKTARRPQPALALANTICMVGAVAGRRVENETKLRTNFYAVGIGGTSCGKEHSMQCTVELLEAAGLEKWIGPGGWKSGSAIVTSIHSHPMQLCNLDELGKILLASSGPRAPSHLLDVRKVLLELFGRANGIYFGDAYADERINPRKKIREPHLCYYGATVPEPFFDALQSSSLTDGFVNRHLVFPVDDDSPKPRPLRAISSLPRDPIVESLRLFEEGTRPPGLAGCALPEMASNCRRIPYTDEAAALWEKIEIDNDMRVADLRARQSKVAEVWCRFPAHVAKLALLKAVARDPRAQFVDVADVLWGKELATWCTERLQLMAANRIADNDTERNTLRVLRFIVDAGAAGISQSNLTKKTFWLTKRERDDIVATLGLARQIHAVTTESERPDRKGKHKTTFFAGPGGDE